MKRILLVADQPGWVFERHCREIQKRLTEYEFGIAYHRQNIAKIAKDYDLVYVLDPMPMQYPDPAKTIMGLRCEFLFREHPEGARGLYKHGFPGRCVSIRDHCCMFHVVNRHMLEVFEPIVKDKPLLLAQHGVDEEIFDCKKYDLVDITRSPSKLRISCSGRNSKNKGFGMIQKAMLKDHDKIISAQYGNGQLTKEEMPLFYSKADVHVCMSENEGLNNPIMEAGSMGLPVISTKTGAAPEIIKDGVNGFLIERSKEALSEALWKLRDDYSARKNMKKAMYNEIMENWTWKVRIEDFRSMFNMYFEEVNK